jgi:HK97 family phage major capsid protein
MKDKKSIYIGSAVKALGNNRIGGYLIVWGDAEHRDLQEEYFTPETNLSLQWYEKRPMLYHHGLDGTVSTKSVGTIDTLKADDTGLWAEGPLELEPDQWEQVQRKKRNEFLRAIDRMVKEGLFNWSSGSLPHMVKTADDGRIIEWPLVEGSLTPTPAEPRQGTGIQSIKSYEELLETWLEEHNPGQDDTGTKAHDKEETYNGGTKMPEMTEEGLRALIEEIVAEYMDTMKQADEELVEEELMTEEDETEVKQVMDDEAVSVLEEAQEVLAAAEEELTAQKARKLIMHNQTRIIKAAYKHMADRKVNNTKAQHQAILEAKKAAQLSTPALTAQEKVGGGGLYGTKDNPGQAPGQTGRAQKPGLASFIKSAANHDFSKFAGKAQNPYIGDHGGYLLGQELRNEILPPLRENVVAFDAGVRQTNVPQGIGTIDLPKMTTAPTAYRPGINTSISDSDASFDTVTAFLRPVAAKVTIPFQLLEQSPLAVEQRIREEMIRSISLLIDIEILTGTGTVTGSNTGAEIRGIKNTLEADSTLSTTNISTLATNGRKPTFADASAAETQLATSNVPDTEPKSWIMHARSRGRFRDLTATTGEPLFRDNFGISAYPDLIGYPLHVGNQIPITDTTGTSTDTSEIYFGAWRYIEYVMQDSLEIIVDRVTLADKLQARIIAYTYSDILIHYPEAFYVMKGVR